MPANSSHTVDTLCAAGVVWYKRIGVIAQNTNMKTLINSELHNGSEHAAVTDLPSKYCLFLEAFNLTCKDIAYSLK